jgi:hypothetical protein
LRRVGRDGIFRFDRRDFAVAHHLATRKRRPHGPPLSFTIYLDNIAARSMAQGNLGRSIRNRGDNRGRGTVRWR